MGGIFYPQPPVNCLSVNGYKHPISLFYSVLGCSHGRQARVWRTMAFLGEITSRGQRQTSLCDNLVTSRQKPHRRGSPVTHPPEHRRCADETVGQMRTLAQLSSRFPRPLRVGPEAPLSSHQKNKKSTAQPLQLHCKTLRSRLRT